MPGLDGDDGQVARAGVFCGACQQRRVGDVFKVEQQQLHIRVMRHGPGQVGHAGIGFVAGGMHMPHTQPPAPQQAIQHSADAAALADDANRPVHRRHLDEHGGEAGNSTRSKVGQALAVGAKQAHATGACALHHTVLHRTACVTRFTKARGNHDGRFHAQCGALSNSGNGAVTAHNNQRQLGHLGQVGQ